MSDNTLAGQRIESIRPMSDEELDREAWTDTRGVTPIVIELEDGELLYPSKDIEGNGPGVLFGYDPNDDTSFWVRPD